MIKLITAIAKNGVLGQDNKMSWHIPDEFKHFKETTMGHSLLMGRTTYLGLPGTLPGRVNYVLSSQARQYDNPDVIAITDAQELINKFKDSEDILFISGGKSIYQQFYKEADELIVTILKDEKNGNVEWSEFFEILKNYKKTKIKDHPQYEVFSYKK